MALSYYDMTNLQDQDLFREQINAESQEARVFNHFINHRRFEFTPFDILHQVFDDAVPVTSVRRAITNLTDRGQLVRTNNKRPGDYGKLCYTWRAK